MTVHSHSIHSQNSIAENHQNIDQSIQNTLKSLAVSVLKLKTIVVVILRDSGNVHFQGVHLESGMFATAPGRHTINIVCCVMSCRAAFDQLGRT